MFTGIVVDMGRIAARENVGGDQRLTVTCERLDLTAVRAGDSICVQGCCLTATSIRDRTFSADISRETLAVTTLGELAVGAPVNLEPALRAGEPLGGHLLSGHVDAVAHIVTVSEEGRSRRLLIEVPAELARYLAPKGSVAVDGVSLTINTVAAHRFGVNIIPHTLAHTTLGTAAPGGRVNLEVDQLARYVERLMSPFTQR